MPEAQRSFYVDMEMGIRYFSYVLKEVLKVCQKFFGFFQKREQSFIMGLSMGGYGSLKCALNKPEKYAECAAFSPVTDIQGRVLDATFEESQEFKAIFGMDLKVPEGSGLFKPAKKAVPSLLPPIYIACGEGDELYQQNVRFAKALNDYEIPVFFEHWDFIIGYSGIRR